MRHELCTAESELCFMPLGLTLTGGFLFAESAPTLEAQYLSRIQYRASVGYIVKLYIQYTSVSVAVKNYNFKIFTSHSE